MLMAAKLWERERTMYRFKTKTEIRWQLQLEVIDSTTPHEYKQSAYFKKQQEYSPF